MTTATVPMAPPRASEPTSPMKTSAGMSVVPEKADAGAHHGPAKYGDFADHGHALQLEVVGKDGVSADVGQNGERGRGDDGATDGQPIQSIGEIHCVAREDDDQGDEDREGHKSEDA